MKYEIRAKSNFSLGLSELWEYKELFYFFTWRDIKVKYKQTVLGFAWAIFQPLIMMLIMTFFFGKALNVPSQGVPYPLFVFSGLLVWNIFSTGLSSSANSMISNGNMIKKIYFPRLIIPLSSVLVSVFDFIMGFIIFLGLCWYYEYSFTASISFFPVAILLAVTSTVGPGCLLASLNIKYRDFRYIIPFLIQALFFIAPVMYPVTMFTSIWLKLIFCINPVVSAIELFRFSVTGIPVNMDVFIPSIISNILFLVIGVTFFRKTETYFADLA